MSGNRPTKGGQGGPRKECQIQIDKMNSVKAREEKTLLPDGKSESEMLIVIWHVCILAR